MDCWMNASVGKVKNRKNIGGKGNDKKRNLSKNEKGNLRRS